MSQRPINLSDDLRRLREEGYDVEIRANHLLVKDVPYVDEQKRVQRGILISKLNLSNDVARYDNDHVVSFSGSHPCCNDGTKLTQLVNGSAETAIGDGLVAHHTFSHKPVNEIKNYRDYHEKMTSYVGILVQFAQAIDPGATARTYPVIMAEKDDSVFHYVDTASSRAGIEAVSEKLVANKVAIIGLGGTGSYVLDLIAKTPIKEIYLYDGDRLFQHNPFRSPGAHSGDEIKGAPNKAEYFSAIYSKMRKNIFPVATFVDESNIEQLKDASFVFLCLDRGGSKQVIMKKLEEFGVPFVDAGMGIHLNDNALTGILRITTSTPTERDHVWTHVPTAEAANNEYSTNIQVADLNALNAALAVVRWKKLCGFYSDLENERSSGYAIDGNHIINTDQA